LAAFWPAERMAIARLILGYSKKPRVSMLAAHKKKLCRRGAEYAKGKTKVFSAYSAPLRREKFLFLGF
jgi:hypothetical protein